MTHVLALCTDAQAACLPSSAWLQQAQQRMAQLTPERLTDISKGQQGIWISRTAARQFESALKHELECWAGADGCGQELVQMVLDSLDTSGTASAHGAHAPAFAAHGNDDLLRMMSGLRQQNLLPAILFNFSRWHPHPAHMLAS